MATPAAGAENPGTADPDNPEYRTVNDPALQYAWQYYITYDGVSVSQKDRHTRQRLRIIWLAIAATIIAVLFAPKPITNFLASQPDIERAVETLRWLFLVAAPIALAGMMSYALQFAPSMAWVVHRVAAEKIRREIYLYRMNAGDYADPNLTKLQKQNMLRQAVNDTRDEIEKIDVPIPAHRVTKTLTEEDVVGKTDNKADRGFKLITGSDYIAYRVIPQRTWYVNKINKDYNNLRNFRTLILIVGGAGSLVAVFGNGWEQYVAITTALVAALTTFTQLKMYGQVYPMYHVTVGKLDAVVANWLGLPSTQRNDPEHYAEYVTQIEDIFNDERLKWMNQATQAMINGDQSLMRNVSDWTRGFDNQETPVPTEEETPPSKPDFLPLGGTAPGGGQPSAGTQSVVPTNGSQPEIMPADSDADGVVNVQDEGDETAAELDLSTNPVEAGNGKID